MPEGNLKMDPILQASCSHVDFYSGDSSLHTVEGGKIVDFKCSVLSVILTV